ncbi:MAG: peroxidase [Comamonadaceae bacterium CG1_02_60_18]|nr:MAG: peroxidase [Comamonadaceae bacterium CG1_02_60_18]PIQ55122.1 MAG: peroxidase [Comamonadaceae bacterium CG12_big_fil_rev_8_21_14_0_65_59_15]
MQNYQPAILDPVPPLARYVFFSVASTHVAQLQQALGRLSTLADGQQLVVGLGTPLLDMLGGRVVGMHDFVPLQGLGVQVPSTPCALCCWLRGGDAGALLHLTRRLQQALAPALQLDQVVEAFRYNSGRDLTGYEDGTENPQGDAASAAALVQGAPAGRTGSSFMVVQQWLHHLDAFDAMGSAAQDNMIGRRRSDNAELDDAPPSAHVKRTAQESFAPEAFVLRRSMPWAQGQRCGLMFVAFGCSFDAFEAQMRRMVGLDDQILDGLFAISAPLTGMHFWCPPMNQGRLDWRALGF